MPLPKAYFNGQWLPIEKVSISPFDRGFMFADGCYEVIPVYQQKPFLLDNHIVRLNYSLQELQIPNPYSDLQWQDIFLKLAQQSNGKAYIYLQITRGASDKREHLPTSVLTPTVLAYCEQVESIEYLPSIKKVCLTQEFRWRRCDIKSIGLVASILAKIEAQKAGFDDLIFYDNGFISESAASNIFIYQNGILKTPPLSNKLLAGITRIALFEIFRDQGFAYVEEAISLESLLSAEEIWMSSSVKELLPIGTIDNHRIGDGKVGPLFTSIWYHWIEKLKNF